MSESSVDSSERIIRTPVPELSFWPYSDQPEWEFRYSGLGSQIAANRLNIDILTQDGLEVHVPKGIIVGNMDFLPFGNKEYLPGTRRPTLVAGMTALQGFFEAIGTADPKFPDRPLPEPEFLFGVTNKQMAEFIERLGFHTIEKAKGWTRWQIMDDPSKLGVVANTNEVRDAFMELSEKHGWLKPGSK